MALPKPLVIVVIVALIIVLVVAAWFVFGGSNLIGNSCPPTVCNPGTKGVGWMQIQATATVLNSGTVAGWAISWVSLTGMATSSPPASPPAGVFTATFVYWMTWTLTYPTGSTYSYSTSQAQMSMVEPGTATIVVNGYNQGPPGGYTAVATLHVQQTGCWLGCGQVDSASRTVQFAL